MQSEATSPPVTDPAPDREADLRVAKASLIGAEDLPGTGWRRSTTDTTQSRTEKKKSGSSFDCPEVDEELGSGFERKAASADSPTFDRREPVSSVHETASLMPDSQSAVQTVQATKRSEFKTCMERGFKHDFAKEDRDVKVHIADWKVPKTGDSQNSFEIELTTSTEGRENTVHVGLAVVQVGRGVLILTVSGLDPVGDDAVTIIKAARQKYIDNS